MVDQYVCDAWQWRLTSVLCSGTYEAPYETARSTSIMFVGVIGEEITFQSMKNIGVAPIFRDSSQSFVVNSSGLLVPDDVRHRT